MTLKYMQGFETMRDDSDFRAQGWVVSPTKQSMGFVPSVSGVTGTSAKIIAPYSTTSTTAGAAGAQDPGFLNTGITVNQAYLAGGFTLGFGATFNSGVSMSYGATTVTAQTAANSAICFDGTLYWAIRTVGSTFNIATSPDLSTWTLTSSQPAGGLTALSSIFALGTTVVVLGTNGSSTAQIVYYTTNLGASWLTQTLGASSASGFVLGSAIATGNATYPHAIMIGTDVGNGSSGNLYIGTLGGTMTSVETFTGSTNGWCAFANRAKIIGNLVVVLSPSNGIQPIYTATASNAALNTTAAWTTGTTQNVPFMDIAYHPTSNLWVGVGYHGIWTIPNTGAAGTPVALSGSITATQRYSNSTTIQNIFLIGTTLYATGGGGRVLSSPDGVTWTDTGSHAIIAGSGANEWCSTIYDGTKYVMCSDSTSGVIATTPDFVSFQTRYVQDGTELAGTFANGFYDTGIFTGTAPDPLTGLWTAGAAMVNLQLSGVTSNTRQAYLVISSTTQWGLTNTVSTTTAYNYWEIVARSVAGSANSFTYALYLNGTLLNSSPTARLLASSTTDTTTLLLVGLGRGGRLIAFDDIYLTLDDSVANTLQGPLGIVNIAARRPSADVQAQWTPAGTAPSNAQSVRQTALSQPTGNSVSSFTNGNKDIYSSTDAVIAGYTVKAVQSEAFFTRTSTTSPSVSLGKVSGGTEVDSPTKAVTSTSASYVSQMFERDPNGNIPWTNTSVTNSQWAINKVS